MSELEYGTPVKNKLTGYIGTLEFSSFGYSVHYKDELGILNKTLGCPLRHVLKYWEVIEEQADTHE